MDSNWTVVKTELKQHIPDHSFRMWIEPLALYDSPDDGIVLSCPNQFFKRRVQEQYLALIENEFEKTTGKKKRFSLVVNGNGNNGGKSFHASPANTQLSLPKMVVRPHMGRLLRKDFTFDQFVVGGNNDFAYCAALSLASKNSGHQNTLFLLSGTGLGKSHLAQATGHHILAHNPRERVYYITAEDFTNEMTRAFRTGAVDEFKTKYRNGCDVLLLEDVQYLSGKERTQIELSIMLESLIECEKKIIFSSCYLPGDIPKLNDKLRSCLASGLISGIEPPDFSTRKRILQKKCFLNGHVVPDDVLCYLASELTDDVRQLESGLIGVAAKSSLMAAPIDLSLAESVVRNIARTRKKITIEAIKKMVCRQFKVSPTDVVSKSRKQCYVRPRQVAIFLSRRYTDAPLQTIGKSFNRYHATALHAIASVDRGIKTDPALKRQVDILCEKLESGNF